MIIEKLSLNRETICFFCGPAVSSAVDLICLKGGDIVVLLVIFIVSPGQMNIIAPHQFHKFSCIKIEQQLAQKSVVRNIVIAFHKILIINQLRLREKRIGFA